MITAPPKSSRSQFASSCALALAAVAVVRSPARAAQFEYKLVSPLPPEFPMVVRLVQMCNAIKVESGGRLQITVFPNSVLGSQSSMLAQLRSGAVQFVNLTHSLFGAIAPVAQISSLGFAFSSSRQATDAMDGALGDYVRREIASKGIYVFARSFDTGFRQTTSSTKPIRAVDDFAGFKIRCLPTPIFIDLFKALGASAVPVDSNELYLSLQTHVVDGMESPLGSLESFRIYEVQRYLSLTKHIWSGHFLATSLDAWNALPPDIQAIVTRNAAKYTILERRDSMLLDAALADKLQRQGLVFNAADTAGMRAQLGPYYARWKNEFGKTAWDLLEQNVGKLG